MTDVEHDSSAGKNGSRIYRPEQFDIHDSSICDYPQFCQNSDTETGPYGKNKCVAYYHFLSLRVTFYGAKILKFLLTKSVARIFRTPGITFRKLHNLDQ